jgi:hypothetical protein
MPWDNSLREVWARAGYSPLGGSVCICPPPSSEYRRVYHLTTTEHAISNLALSRLKIARFSDVNDPFELIALNFRESETRRIIRDFKNSYNTRTGLLCFSANWTNPVLWSHYGAKHTGICLGFDLERSLSPQTVEYEDDRIQEQLPPNGDPTALPPELRDRLLRTKYSHWKYEEEVRVFIELDKSVREGGLNFYPFDTRLILREVILGPQCSLSVKSVRDLVSLRYPGAITFKSRLAFKFFSVVPKESTVP